MFSPLDVDEAYNLQVSWHLWYQHSYATVHGWFDPYISTGPTVLIPTALLVPFHPFAPRLVILVYLIGLFYIAYRWYLHSLWYTVVWITAIWLLPHASIYLFHVLGEIPGLFFILTAYVAIAKKNEVLGGILLGLAAVTKLVYMFSLVPLIFERKFKAIFIALLPAAAWHLMVIFAATANREVIRALAWPRIDMFPQRLIMIHEELGVTVWLWLLCSALIWIRGAQRYNEKQLRLLSVFAWVYGSYYLLLYSNYHYRTLYPLLVITLLIAVSLFSRIIPLWEKKR